MFNWKKELGMNFRDTDELIEFVNKHFRLFKKRELFVIIEKLVQELKERGEMKVKIGMFVRTLDGINKVIDVLDNGVMARFVNEDNKYCFVNELLCNPSFEILEVLRVGDYVNGYKVKGINENFVLLDKANVMKVSKEDIKTIMTKEQAENIEYKMGD